jgi:acetyl esterase/lipase
MVSVKLPALLSLRFTLASATVALAAPAGAQGILQRSGTEPRQLRDLAYVENGHARQRLDLYLPGGSTAAAVVLWVHGGGWEGGSKDHAPAEELVRRGYAVASIGYRLSQHATYPAQIEDCKAAVRWLRANAKSYHLDPARVGVWGASAGGHLAALLGTTGHLQDFDRGENLSQSSKVQCVIDWFGPTDFLHYGDPPQFQLDQPGGLVARLLGGTVRSKPEAAKRASPVSFVEPSAAPFLIMHGDRDDLVPLQQSEILHTALRKAGVQSTLRVFRGAGHGGPSFSSPEARRAMLEFLEQHLGRP